jgi:hypothetical protein
MARVKVRMAVVVEVHRDGDAEEAADGGHREPMMSPAAASSGSAGASGARAAKDAECSYSSNSQLLSE